MSVAGPPLAPQVFQDLLLAERTSRLLGAAGEKVELWEVYSLARSDRSALTAEADRIAEGLGGTNALQDKLRAVRQGTGPLIAYLRELLAAVLPQPPEPLALEVSLVFIMTSPQAREKAVRWAGNPAQSQGEATALLRIMGRMVEGYRQAMIDSLGAPPTDKPASSPKTATEPDDLERRLQAKIEAERRARTERITRAKVEAEGGVDPKTKAEAEKAARGKAEAERIEKEKAEAERSAREKAEEERVAHERAEAERAKREREAAERAAREREEAERLERERTEAERIARKKAEAERIAREKADAERVARERAEAERIAREKAEAERIGREKAEAERVAREKAEAERVAREKAEAERIAREKAEAERVAREKAEAERIAREKAEAQRIAREKAEAERIAREKAQANRIAREKADALLSPGQRTARDQARAALREKLSVLLADPWRDQEVGAWFRVKAVVGGETTYTDMGLRERGAGFTVQGVQQCIGGRSEWEKWERTELRSVENLGQELLDVGGSNFECDVYRIVSRAGEEKLWIALDAPHAGAPLKSESPGRAFLAKKVEAERLSIGTCEFECVRTEGEESAGGKTAPAVYWWSLPYPLGPVKALIATGSTEAVRAGDNWNNRPPFPA